MKNEITLQKVFAKKTKVDSSDKRMQQIQDVLSESKTGQKTLDFIKDNNVNVVFEKMKDCYGYFDPDNNVIALNPLENDNGLAVTLVHEARHAWQGTQMEMGVPTLTPKSSLAETLALEADACLAEAQFAYEMREKRPEIEMEQQESVYGEIVETYAHYMDVEKDPAKAKEQAFLAWYRNETVEYYTDDAIDVIASDARQQAKTKSDPKYTDYLSEPRSAEELASLYLKNEDGKIYLPNPSVLETTETLALNENQAKKMAKAVKPLIKKGTHTAESMELDKIFVQKNDKTIGTCIEFSDSSKQPANQNNDKKTSNVVNRILAAKRSR